MNYITLIERKKLFSNKLFLNKFWGINPTPLTRRLDYIGKDWLVYTAGHSQFPQVHDSQTVFSSDCYKNRSYLFWKYDKMYADRVKFPSPEIDRQEVINEREKFQQIGHLTKLPMKVYPSILSFSFLEKSFFLTTSFRKLRSREQIDHESETDSFDEIN